MKFKHDQYSELDRLNLVHDVYYVLCKYLPKYERRGFNFHARAQNIAEMVALEFDNWLEQNKSAGGLET